MKVGFRAGQFDDVANQNIALMFKDWTQQLNNIIEQRLFLGAFEKIVNYLSEFSSEIVDRMTDERQEEELIFCSRYNFTLSQIALQLSFYRDKVEREYEIWLSKKLIEAQKKFLEEQKRDVESGIRTKGSIGNFTKDDLRGRVIYEFEDEFRLWNEYMAEVKRAQKFVENMLTDIDKRAMILMAIARKRRG